MEPQSEVKQILKCCGIQVTDADRLTAEIDKEGKKARWDPCNTLINDAIHGPVELNSLLTKIINTPEFQRLRYIKQLGGGCFVYPGANHTRFDHSIGVCHIAGEFAHFLKHQLEEEYEYSNSGTKKNIMDDSRYITNKEVLCLQIAGLCHDLGHGPFSHTFEHRVLDRMEDVSLSHEELSLKIFDCIMKNSNVLVEFVYVYKLGHHEVALIKDMIHPKRSRSPSDSGRLEGRAKKEFLLEIVANKESGIDVDKWDYFTRDCHYLGIAMDFQWKRCMLLSRICDWNGNFHICFRNKELDNLYGMGRTRSTLHRKAYVHKTKVAVEEMFARAMDTVKEVPLIMISNDDKEQGSGDENVKPIKTAIQLAQSGDLRWFMALTDTSVTTLIMNWKQSEKNEIHKSSVLKAQKILRSIESRHLYHLVDSKRFPKYRQPKKPDSTCTVTAETTGEETTSQLKQPSTHDRKKESDDKQDDIASQNVTKMMTKLKNETEEKERKENLKKLNVEIFEEAGESSATFVDIVPISFGSEKKTDPVEGVRFYNKDDPHFAIEWKDLKQESSSLVLPKEFTEYEIRVYYTGPDGINPGSQLDENKKKLLKETFQRWLKEKIEVELL